MEKAFISLDTVIEKLRADIDGQMENTLVLTAIYNLWLGFVVAIDEWLASEPSRVRFVKWRKWKKSRPLWSDFDKAERSESNE